MKKISLVIIALLITTSCYAEKTYKVIGKAQGEGRYKINVYADRDTLTGGTAKALINNEETSREALLTEKKDIENRLVQIADLLSQIDTLEGR